MSTEPETRTSENAWPHARGTRSSLDGQWRRTGTTTASSRLATSTRQTSRASTRTWMDPVFNIEVAFAIWSEQGWYPWSCRPY